MTFSSRALSRISFYLCLSLLLVSTVWSSELPEHETIANADSADESSLFKRPSPLAITAQSYFSEPSLIMAFLEEGGLEPENLAEIIKECGPYCDGSRGAQFWKAFISHYSKDSGIDTHLFPLEFFMGLHAFIVDEKEGAVHVLDPQTKDEVSTFVFPKVIDADQRAQFSPFYQALTLAALFGDSRALTAQTNIRMLAHKAGRDDFVPLMIRMGLSAQGTVVEDFKTWAHVLKTMVVDLHDSKDSETKLARQLDFCDLLNLRCVEGWLNQLDQGFGGVKESLTYDQAMSVMVTAEELGNTLNHFVTGLMGLYTDEGLSRWSAETHPDSITHMHRTLPKAGKILMSVQYSVDQFLQLVQVRSIPGADMHLKDVESGSMEELDLYEARYKVYDAFAGDFLFDESYMKALIEDPEAREHYEIYIKVLWADLTVMGIGYLTHPQNQTKNMGGVPLDLPVDEMVARLSRKEVRLKQIVGYMNLAQEWSRDRSDYYVEVVQRATQDKRVWNITEETFDISANNQKTVVASAEERHQTAREALDVFQTKTSQPFLKRLGFTRGLRNFAKPLLKAAAIPDQEDQTPTEFAALVRKHFDTQGVDEAHMAYVKAFEESAAQSEGSPVEFVTAFIQARDGEVKTLLEGESKIAQKNVRLLASTTSEKIFAAAAHLVLKTFLDQSEKASQEGEKSRLLIESSTPKIELFLGEAETYEKTHETLAASLVRIKGELADL